MSKFIIKKILNKVAKKVDHDIYTISDYYIILESHGCILTKDLETMDGLKDEFINYQDFFTKIQKEMNNHVVSKKAKA
jgi:hypothetical protein